LPSKSFQVYFGDQSRDHDETKKEGFDKRREERDEGGHPQHFLKLAAEAKGRGAREKIPATKYSPPEVLKKSKGRTRASSSEENDSASESESDSEEAASAAKTLIRLNSMNPEKKRKGGKGAESSVRVLPRAFTVEVKLAQQPLPQCAPKFSSESPSVSFDIFADMPFRAQESDENSDSEVDEAISFESQLSNKLYLARDRLGIDLTEEGE